MKKKLGESLAPDGDSTEYTGYDMEKGNILLMYK